MGIAILDYLAKKTVRRPVREVLSDRSVVSERGAEIRVNRPYTDLGLLECGSLENKGWFYAKQILSIGGVVDAPPPRAALPTVQSSLVNFASTDLLGLAGHHDTVRVARETLERFGLSAGEAGRCDPVLNMEDEFARYMGLRAADSRGSFADLCTDLFAALVDERDAVYLWHGCDPRIVRGACASGARVVEFSPKANLTGHADGGRQDRFAVVVASAFDRARLTVSDLAGCASFAAEKGALMIVDESGCLGVMGDWGRGAAQAQGLSEQVPVIVAETGYGLPDCGGGIVAGHKDVVEAVRAARDTCSSVEISPPAAAGLAQALILLARQPDRRKRLHENAEILAKVCADGGLDVLPGNYPVVRIALGAGIDGAALRAAAEGESVHLAGVRTSETPTMLPLFVTADHTREHLEQAAATLRAASGEGGPVGPERT